MKLDWPLMVNNISEDDLECLIRFLKTNPRLTQSEQVRLFEEEWSRWVGVKHSVFVNSGSSANVITIGAARHLFGEGEVIVPPLTWVSDIAAVLHAGMTPVFADIDPRTLGMDTGEVLRKITPRTKAVFLTHILGYNALSEELLGELEKRNIILIEDACESHGAEFKGRRAGSFGFASNFSFYYAHHLSTIEGGMVCTNDSAFYETLRMMRSHGLVREASSPAVKEKYREEYPDLNPEFIFAFPAHNVRNTEINAVLGRAHLPRLDEEVLSRRANLGIFLSGLDKVKYRTDFAVEGNSNYALTLVLQESFKDRAGEVMRLLDSLGVECRRGTSGGGNQLRQPYLRKLFGEEYKQYPRTDFIHFYGFYIGNYPGLEKAKIEALCESLNAIR